MISFTLPNVWRTCLLAAAMLAACNTVPETGRSQLLLVSAGEALQLSLGEFEKIKKSTPISQNAAHNQLVTTVGRRIAAVAPLKNAQWEFVVFDQTDVMNAFALPGGKVGVYSGILAVTQNEAGLATVLAHEVAHATARHGEERMSQGLLMQFGGQVLAVAMSDRPAATQQLIQSAYGIGGSVGVMLPHSRLQELEADRIGLSYMARAGYDPREAVAFWKRFAAHKSGHGGDKPIAFLSTHPLDAQRITQLEDFMPEAMMDYRSATKH